MAFETMGNGVWRYHSNLNMHTLFLFGVYIFISFSTLFLTLIHITIPPEHYPDNLVVSHIILWPILWVAYQYMFLPLIYEDLCFMELKRGMISYHFTHDTEMVLKDIDTLLTRKKIPYKRVDAKETIHIGPFKSKVSLVIGIFKVNNTSYTIVVSHTLSHGPQSLVLVGPVRDDNRISVKEITQDIFTHLRYVPTD